MLGGRYAAPSKHPLLGKKTVGNPPPPPPPPSLSRPDPAAHSISGAGLRENGAAPGAHTRGAPHMGETSLARQRGPSDRC